MGWENPPITRSRTPQYIETSPVSQRNPILTSIDERPGHGYDSRRQAEYLNTPELRAEFSTLNQRMNATNHLEEF